MKLTDQRPIVRRTGRRVRLARSLDSIGGLSRRLPRWHLLDGAQVASAATGHPGRFDRRTGSDAVGQR